MSERRVWRVPRGQVRQNIEAASINNCPEIQEVDGLLEPTLYVEMVADQEPSVEDRLSLLESKVAALEIVPR